MDALTRVRVFFCTRFFVRIFDIFKELALGRFFHRVAMSVYISIYVPFSCNLFLRGIRQALAWNKTGLHAWSLKNGGWV